MTQALQIAMMLKNKISKCEGVRVASRFGFARACYRDVERDVSLWETSSFNSLDGYNIIEEIFKMPNRFERWMRYLVSLRLLNGCVVGKEALQLCVRDVVGGGVAFLPDLFTFVPKQCSDAASSVVGACDRQLRG